LYFVFGKCIEQPHAFIGVDRVAEEEHKKRKQKSGSFQHEDSRAAENPRQLAD
jgi:hypothetical protein